MRISITILMLLISSLYIKAQMNIGLRDEKPIIPSWESYEFIKHDKIGTSLYTGTIDYSLPIYTYKDKDFEIPIYLNYSTNGFRVNRKSGIIGYGWSLNVPGIITREIRGVPDETNKVNILKNEGSSFTMYGFKHSKPELNNYGTFFTNEGKIYSGKFEGSNVYESTPDLYYFNFCGYTGTFERDYNGKFKIFETSGSIKSFNIISFDETYDIYASSEIKITDTKGYIYIFKVKEYCIEESTVLGASDTGIIKSWYLYSIIAPSGRSVKFNYTAGNNFKKNYDFFPTCNYFAQFCVIGGNLSDSYETNNYIIHDRITYTKELNSIVFDDNTKINFSYSAANEEIRLYNVDGSTAKVLGDNNRLESIKVLKDENIIKSCLFEYHHSTPVSGVGNGVTFLKNIRLSGEGTYSFEYNDMYGYPYLGTAEYDHWGYYNGKGFPLNSKAPIEYNTTTYEEIINGDYKDPLYDAALSGTLKKIVYPTGGFSELTYEPHSYSKQVERTSAVNFIPTLASLTENKTAGGIRIKRIKSFLQDSTLCETTDYEYTINESSSLSSGILTNTPRYGISYNSTGAAGQKTVRYYNLANYMYDYCRTHIEYSRVSVKKSGNGRTDYEYSTSLQYPDTISDNTGRKIKTPTVVNIGEYSYPADFNTMFSNTAIENILSDYPSFQCKRGKLLSESVYNESGNLIRKTINNYSFPVTHIDTVFQVVGEVAKEIFIPRHNIELVSTAVNDYNGSYSISKSTSYTYNDYGLTRTVTNNTSCGDYIRTTNYYVTDTVSGIYNTMKDNNIISALIKSEKHKINGTTELFISSSKYEYYNPDPANNVLALPYKKYDLIKYYGWKEQNSYKYDNKGNLIEEKDANNFRTSFLWSYKGRYMVSAVNNASIEETNTALSSAGLISSVNLRDIAEPSDDTFEKLKKLSELMPSAMVNIYRYEPLVGITEIVQPNSLKNYYYYDGYGRIKEIKDNSLKTKSRFEYNNLSVKNLSTSLNCSSKYYINNTLNITLDIAGGSGIYSHSWKLKDSNGVTCYEHAVDSRIFSVKPDTIGIIGGKQYILECTTGDLVSGEISTVSKNISIEAAPLKFSFINESINLNSGSGIKSARLYVDGTDTVTFRFSNLSGMCLLVIGGKSYSYTGKKSDVEIIQQLSSGEHEVYIEIGEAYSEVEATLTIESANNHDIGSPNSLTLSF